MNPLLGNTVPLPVNISSLWQPTPCEILLFHHIAPTLLLMMLARTNGVADEDFFGNSIILADDEQKGGLERDHSDPGPQANR